MRQNTPLSDAERLARAKRNAEILAARIEEGLTYSQLAERFGLRKQTIAGIIEKLIAAETREKAETLRGIEGVRLERLQTKARRWSDNEDPQVSLRGIEAETKIHARRAKLLGLDAPEKRELTGADGAPIQVEAKTEVTATQARQAMRQLFGNVGPSDGIGIERGLDPDAQDPEGKPPGA